MCWRCSIPGYISRADHVFPTIVAFSRGSRQCLGMHLGSAEIYSGIAGVFRQYGREMSIVNTIKERDVDISHDLFTRR